MRDRRKNLQFLNAARHRFAARVRADGAMVVDGQPGSIHRLDSLLQGLDACNGWTECNGALMSVDELRRIARLGMEGG